MVRAHLVVSVRLNVYPFIHTIPRHARLFNTSHIHQHVFEDIEARGLIDSITNPKLRNVINSSAGKLTAYVGVDPTAPSLHVGNLVPLIPLIRLFLAGNRAIALVGDGTGEVGDPTGRNTARDPMSGEMRTHNSTRIHKQLVKLFENAKLKSMGNETAAGQFTVLSNGSWLRGLTLFRFLGLVGQHARMSQLLARTSVRERLASEQGLSFSEFTYQLLQAYDFYHLWSEEGCTLQIGGSDQWGNIVSGIDLISSIGRQQGLQTDNVFGMTTPLLTTPSGEKFGKSAGNAVFIDPALTSPFQFYQFFVRVHDSVVGDYLRMFSFSPISPIVKFMEEHERAVELRRAQHLLAHEMTSWIHGTDIANKVETASSILFPVAGTASKSITKTEVDAILETMMDDKCLVTLMPDEIFGVPIARIARNTGLAKSANEAEKLIKSGGLYINQLKIESPRAVIEPGAALDGRLVIFRAGKWNYRLIQLA